MILYTVKNGVYYNLEDFRQIMLNCWEKTDFPTKFISI